LSKRKTITDSLGRERKASRESWGKVRVLPSGRFQASYVVTGTRYTAPSTFTTRLDARGWLSVKRSEVERAEWKPRTVREQVTFRDYANAYVQHKTVAGRSIRPSTRANYLQLIETALADFHDVDLEAITPESVAKWHSAKVQRGRLTQTARAYQVLRAVLAYAVENHRIQENPARIKGAVKGKTGKRVEPPTDTELAIIVATIDPRLSLMVEVAAWGGPRYGELTELRRGDFELETLADGTAYYLAVITRAVARVGGEYIVGTPKSAAGTRSVALPPTLTAAIQSRLSTLINDDALVFPSLSNPREHFHSGAFAQYWRKARGAAGRTDMPFHALRHYGLTRFARTGATTRELMTRAGHSDITTALRYQHSSGRDAALAALMVEL
jgi:integrase